MKESKEKYQISYTDDISLASLIPNIIFTSKFKIKNPPSEIARGLSLVLSFFIPLKNVPMTQCFKSLF